MSEHDDITERIQTVLDLLFLYEAGEAEAEILAALACVPAQQLRDLFLVFPARVPGRWRRRLRHV